MSKTKNKILDAVIAYIKEKPSLEKVSIAQIASRAGIGKSTVYDYFEKKDSLLEEAYLYLLDEYEEILFKDIPYQTYEDAMKFQLRNILNVMQYAKTIMESIIDIHQNTRLLDFNKCTKKVTLIQSKMSERFIEIYKMGFNEGLISPSNNPYIEHVLQAIITGLMFQFINDKIDIDEAELIQLVYKQVTEIMKP